MNDVITTTPNDTDDVNGVNNTNGMDEVNGTNDTADAQAPDAGNGNGGSRTVNIPTGRANTVSFTVKHEVDDYIKRSLEMYGELPDPEVCTDDVLIGVNQTITMLNTALPKGEKFPRVKELPGYAIAEFLLAHNDIIRVAPGLKGADTDEDDGEILDESKLPLGIYQHDGVKKGIYAICESADAGVLCELIRQYNPQITSRGRKEVFLILKSKAPVMRKTTTPYLAAVGNCIYDALHKEVIPFSKDYVFTSKIRTHLNLAAVNPMIPVPQDGSVWNPEDWMKTLAPNDPELVDLFWQVIQASCLPLVPRNKMVVLASEKGNNGKGTICELIRTVLGEGQTANIPLDYFEKPFALGALPNAVAIVVDENSVKAYLKDVAILKSVITGDRITINQKYVQPFDYSFNGLVLECVNSMLQVKDKTGSFCRRLLLVKMPSCFTGKEKKYIKAELIRRRDVREYILKKVLVDMPYRDSFSEPKCCKEAMKEYIQLTNSVVAFCDEILPKCVWDLLPATDFLYEMYKIHYSEAHPDGHPVGRNEFIEEVKNYVDDPNNQSEWEWTDCTRSAGRMEWKEPLIEEYDLPGFARAYYYASNYEAILKRDLKEKYSGLKRKIPKGNPYSQAVVTA